MDLSAARIRINFYSARCLLFPAGAAGGYGQLQRRAAFLQQLAGCASGKRHGAVIFASGGGDSRRKHGNPCGVAVATTIEEAFVRARNATRYRHLAALLPSILRDLQEDVAEVLAAIFLEAIIAPQVFSTTHGGTIAAFARKHVYDGASGPPFRRKNRRGNWRQSHAAKCCISAA